MKIYEETHIYSIELVEQTNNVDEQIEWCNQALGEEYNRWYIYEDAWSAIHFKFLTESDRTMFVLKWS